MTDGQKIEAHKIADHYGLENQALQTVEECSELIVAIMNKRRDKGTVDDIVDEIADVEIMCEQMRYAFDCSGQVDERIKQKLERQHYRIEVGA